MAGVPSHLLSTVNSSGLGKLFLLLLLLLLLLFLLGHMTTSVS